MGIAGAASRSFRFERGDNDTWQIGRWVCSTIRMLVVENTKFPSPNLIQVVSLDAGTIDICRLTTGIRSEKCVVRRFRRCANVIQCTYTNLNSTV